MVRIKNLEQLPSPETLQHIRDYPFDIYFRGTKTGDVFADAKHSGHECPMCDFGSEEHDDLCPAQENDALECVITPGGEHILHPANPYYHGVCCAVEGIAPGYDVGANIWVIVFTGRDVPASVFDVPEGHYVVPETVLGVFHVQSQAWKTFQAFFKQAQEEY